MADGYYDTSSNIGQTLIEEWNGSAWSILSSPTANSDSLYGVSCLGVGFCMAAGDYGPTGTSAAQTLIEEN
jgi:hypothetical protein